MFAFWYKGSFVHILVSTGAAGPSLSPPLHSSLNSCVVLVNYNFN